MLTIFATPKPFRGHVNIIQRNALKSWTLLHPGVEVILFGDDEGAAEVAREAAIRHVPHVERNDAGMKRVDYIFGTAQTLARHELLCYVNCDIILMGDFVRALEHVRAKYTRFLMVGRRWDTPITEAIEFSDRWDDKIRKLAVSVDDRQNQWYIDYFAFARGTFVDDFPPLVLGTVRWDNWLIWKALNSKVPVIDASEAVVAVHQNHDYSYHPQGKEGVWEGEAAKRNLELAGGWKSLRSIYHATRQLTSNGQIRGTWFRRQQQGLREMRKNPRDVPSIIWYSFLTMTYESRRAIGLNRERITRLKAKFAARENRG